MVCLSFVKGVEAERVELGENIRVTLTRPISYLKRHISFQETPFVKRQRCKTFSPFLAHDRIFCRDFPKSSLSQERKCPQKWEGKDTWRATRQPARSSQPSLLAPHFLPERMSFLDRACLLSFLPNTLPNPRNLDFLFKERCLERKIDQEQPTENTSQLVDTVLSDMSSVSSEAHFLCLMIGFLSFHFICSLRLSLMNVFCYLFQQSLAESSIL